jgi:hypothetical protein
MRRLEEAQFATPSRHMMENHVLHPGQGTVLDARMALPILKQGFVRFAEVC